MLIFRRNAMMAGGGKRLPYDAEVEYMENTRGTERIDTQIIADISTVITATFQSFNTRLPDDQGSGDAFAIGAVGWQGQSAVGFALNRDQGTWYLSFGEGYKGASASNDRDNNKKTVVLSRAGLTVNGSSRALPSAFSGVVSPQSSMLIFSAHNRRARLYSFTIETNGVTVRDFIPVRFTNELGQTEGAMFDRANPTVGMNPDGSARDDGLYRNRRTGAFIVGPDI